MAMYPNDAAGMERAVANAIHEHWKLFLIEGIILVILGIAAIIVPPIAARSTRLATSLPLTGGSSFVIAFQIRSSIFII